MAFPQLVKKVTKCSLRRDVR